MTYRGCFLRRLWRRRIRCLPVVPALRRSLYGAGVQDMAAGCDSQTNSQRIERKRRGPGMSGRAGEYCGTALLDYHARPTHFSVSIGAALPHVACWALELPAVDEIRLSGAG